MAQQQDEIMNDVYQNFDNTEAHEESENAGPADRTHD